MKKFLLAAFVALMLTVTAFAVSADDFNFNDAAKTEELVAYLEEKAPEAGTKNINITDFKISSDNTLDLYQLCIDEAPLLFQFKQIVVVKDAHNEYITHIRFLYKDGYDHESYVKDVETCKAKAGELLYGIKDNDSLDTVTKALLLYDRLAMICRYDNESVAAGVVEFGSDTMYGPFIKGKAICTGYTGAYMYLLREIGVDSRTVRSKDGEVTVHAWLVVTMNGIEYHADLTYDDSEPDVQGRMAHDYFLISSARLNSLGQNKIYHKHNFELTDTRYEDKYWKNSETQIVFADGFIYFINNRIEKERGIYLVDPADPTYTPVKLIDLTDYWIKSKVGNSYEAYANYHCLSTDGNVIFYSTPRNIYAYDLTKGTTRVICAPVITGEYDNIYGFRYDNGDLVYSIHYAPNFGDSDINDVFNDEDFQIREKYDPDAAPTPNKTPVIDVPDPGTDPDDSVITVYFTDVKKNHWYFGAVEYALVKGYMNGMSKTTFAPNGNIKREQFVLILANIAGVNTDNYKNVSSGMTDVPTGQWYSGAVAWAVEKGYVSGMTLTTFGRGRDITRAQLARLFYVYAEKNGIDVKGRAELSSFADKAKVQDWMYDGLSWAVDAGIINGMEIGGKLSLDPNGSAIRAQCAVMLQKFDVYRGK
ncbi:MAG: S-layer homology domain-containing protein [Clostridia bacterium]|nr:S-layer homology domain-containing protein [Clostridia bacterium]